MLRKVLVLFFSLQVALSFAQPQTFTSTQGDITMTPILHATMVLEWNGVTIYADPYGGADRFADFTPADIVLITHVHGDHLNHETLAGLDLSKAQLIAPQSVVNELGEITFNKVNVLANGETVQLLGLGVEAVPMYNLPETPESRHPKGKGNGYVLAMGGNHIYISGDTEDVLEMRKLKNIDYAFVCMNLPYTMDVQAAAAAVIDFKPKVVFPFHYRGGGGIYSDVVTFKKLVNQGAPDVEVRILDWYPE